MVDSAIDDIALPSGAGLSDLAIPDGPEKCVVRGVTAVVGGVEYAVGGWGEYEATRRRERWRLERKGVVGGAVGVGSRYADRQTITGDDAVGSLLQGRHDALSVAAERLAVSLGRLEDRLCDPSGDGIWECLPASALRPGLSSGQIHAYAVPPVTSFDIMRWASNDTDRSDVNALYELSDDVTAIVAALGGDLPPPLPAIAGLPPLPSRAVAVSDDEAVLRLEAGVVPRVTAIEELRAALAVNIDKAATVIDSALAKNPAP